MAFICVLNDEKGWGDLLETEAKVSVNTVIGYDDETDHVYHLYVSFDRQNTGYFEPSFYIQEFDEKDEPVYEYFHSTETKSFLDRESRRRVLANVLAMIRTILGRHKFDTCIFYSMDVHLPPEALLKYTYVSAIFFSFGYIGEYMTTSDGQHIWKFLRAPL